MVRAVQQAASLEADCRNQRPAIELPGVLRWARWPVQAVQAALQSFKALMPDPFPYPATLAAFATCLGVLEVLAALRPIGEPFLANVSTPPGFLPRHSREGGCGGACQQQVGPDPPGLAASGCAWQALGLRYTEFHPHARSRYRYRYPSPSG